VSKDSADIVGGVSLNNSFMNINASNLNITYEHTMKEHIDENGLENIKS
jgi:hypothetical protein